uniref:Kazal-like serine protease inhibitor EPI12 n=1 Tax=Phytophthora infestans TaxID=4787 RepID=Q6PQG1_PHYIN|nr:Kazal-like serine protease inhibitor EPI12 [Phytophthora infestans]
MKVFFYLAFLAVTISSTNAAGQSLDPCDKRNCESHEGLVCSNGNQTYATLCDLTSVMCNHPTRGVSLAYDGPCRPQKSVEA